MHVCFASIKVPLQWQEANVSEFAHNENIEVVK